MDHNNNAHTTEKYGHDTPGYDKENAPGAQFQTDPEGRGLVVSDQNALHKDLKGRHMQMIAM